MEPPFVLTLLEGEDFCSMCATVLPAKFRSSYPGFIFLQNRDDLLDTSLDLLHLILLSAIYDRKTNFKMVFIQVGHIKTTLYKDIQALGLSQVEPYISFS
ncbi:MAG: hypothetical protein DRP47_05080 [Candidatus Zixiibacteriota bacterium]|nr:MAG: hypothetical protein DRP47_05080 [candidate division Zixibacteria bacterium]